MAELDASRGTAIWAFNLFRSDALSQLLQDLLRLEKSGLTEDKCEKVQIALRSMQLAASGIPDGTFFSRALFSELEEFKNVYVRWNEVNGTSDVSIEARAKVLNQLASQRHKIAKRVRKHQHVLSTELDLQVVDTMYGAFKDLVTALPDLFKRLGAAVGRFEARRA